jgi:glutamine amidotransferase-like uncharacterized protein
LLKNHLEVKIYNGPGTSHKGIYYIMQNLREHSKNVNITLIGPSDFNDNNVLSKCDILMILGGRDIPYNKHLNGRPNLIIKNYVSNGGKFLGICAGAYYASAKVVFAEGTDQEITGDRELKFYEDICKGPVLAKYYYNSIRGARAAKIGISNFLSKDLFITYMHFNGGGAFINAEKYKNVEIIAKYLDIDEEPPAIIKINYGKGVVILSGIHFEYCNSKNMSYTSKKYRALLSSFNETNSKFFDYIMNVLRADYA